MIHVDIHEPQRLVDLISQGHSVEVTNLNHMGFADILWHTWDGRVKQKERKQARELLSGWENIRLQIRRQVELGVADNLELLVEGAIGPHPNGTATYGVSKDGKLLYGTGTFHRPYAAAVGWFLSLREAGVEVTFLRDTEALAQWVVAEYKRDSEPGSGSSTFDRYVKPRPYVKDYDPNVLTIMGVEHGGCGEEIAKALVSRFGTAYEVFMASAEDLAAAPLIRDGEDRRRPGRVGVAKAQQLIKALGRPYL